MKQAVVFIPGLGDDRLGKPQQRLFSLWTIYGVKAVYQPMYWSDKRSFSSKLDALLNTIDELKADGHLVSLISASAGASAALIAYSLRQASINNVVCVCGKINNPASISQNRYKDNPAFKESMAILDNSLAKITAEYRRHILSLRPISDNIVPPQDTLIEGANNRLMLSIGHGFSIFYALTIDSFRIISFVFNNK